MTAVGIVMGIIIVLPYTRSIVNKISKVLIFACDWFYEKTLRK